jgi:hypothetical protein
MAHSSGTGRAIGNQANGFIGHRHGLETKCREAVRAGLESRIMVGFRDVQGALRVGQRLERDR